MTHKARIIARIAHGDQTYGSNPYMYHLDKVAQILKPYGPDAVTVGYLHDVVEDTDVSTGDLAELFSNEIADLVSLVTDEPGRTRAERKKATNEKLSQVDRATGRIALIVKAADRLANLRESAGAWEYREFSKLNMYCREHPEFKSAAYRPGLCDALWEEMDKIIHEHEVMIEDIVNASKQRVAGNG